ncbi:MAG: hypothetical protein ABI851_03685 [Saprospiraceae bacterium]
MENFDFNEIKRKIISYLDHEMNQEEAEKFLTSMDKNPTFSREFQSQRLIRDKIKENFQRPNLAPGLHDKIRDSIRGK